jgi:hypothetical protein
MGPTVWNTGGCQSWYLNEAGRNPTLWPGSTLRFRRLTRRIDEREYLRRPATAPAPGSGADGADDPATALALTANGADPR